MCFTCGKRGHKALNCKEKLKTSNPEAMTAVFQETALNCGENRGRREWCLDSGATSHMTACREKFELFHEESELLSLASAEKTQIKGRGAVEVKIDDGKGGLNASLKDTLFVPDLRTNLMSVSKLTDRGNKVTFERDVAYVVNPENRILAVAKRRGNLYIVPELGEEARLVEKRKSATLMWHERLGHLNEASMRSMLTKGVVYGVKSREMKDRLETCQVCIKGKQSQTPFPKRDQERTENLLEIIHTDICGPMRTESKCGARYFATFIDDKSRWCEIYFLKDRSEILDAFKNFKVMVENVTGLKIKTLQSDNALEYVSKSFETFLKQNGIKRRLTVPHTPQQNGIAERKNRTLVETARCMLLQSNLPPSFWAEAISTANYIRNRVPSKALNGETPFKKWTGNRPFVYYFRTFGTTALALNKDPKKGKFDSRSIECVFVGYASESKAYKLWSPKDNKFFRSRDVQFLSSFLPSTSEFQDFHQSVLPERGKVLLPVLPLTTSTGLNDIQVGARRGLPGNDAREEIAAVDVQEDPTAGVDDPEPIEAGDDDREGPAIAAEEGPTVAAGEVPAVPAGEGPFAEEEARDDEQTDVDARTAADVEPNDVTPSTSRGPGRPKIVKTGNPGRPRKVYNMIEKEKANLVTDPTDVNEAVNGPDAKEWKSAIIEEYIALMENSTWDIVDLPKGQKLIDSRFVLKTKLRSNGEIERRKARLVAKGYNQRPGIDFHETFAPVVRMSTIRIMMALATEMKLIVHQMDVVSAYLNGDLDEELYMNLPEELESSLKEIVATHRHQDTVCKSQEWLRQIQSGGRKACRLQRSIYGLRQSGRMWNRKLDHALKSLGLKPSAADPCLYVQRTGETIMLIAIYVDDLVIATNNVENMRMVKESLQRVFKMKDLGPIHYCLGIEIKQDLEANTITMSQKKYAEEILNRFGMENCAPISCPLDANEKLKKTETEEDSEFPYQSLVGSLMYLAISTRPDIAYAVSALSQFNSNPGVEHWNAAKRVLRYIRGTTDYKLTYRREGTPIRGYVDADWASCTDDRRSYTGYAFILANAAVSWDAKKQRTVALSSTESEYMALCEGTKEAIYLRNLLEEIGIQKAPMILFNDNQGAQQLIKNSVHHNRSKHIDIRYFFIKEAFENKVIDPKYLSTENMLADVLTKPLHKPKHSICVKLLGITSDEKLIVN